MTVDEFITEFDILYNNIASNAAPSVDNYEKSVFLTKAQSDIVIELYNGKSIPGISFESTEEARLYLRELTKSQNYTKVDNDVLPPKDLMFITYEQAVYASEDECIRNHSPYVVPIRQDYLHRILKNPFKGPSKDRVIRVDMDGVIRLYSKYPIKMYTIHYLRRPLPIVLEDLEDVSIDGINTVTECELNPILHRAILERAVALAKIAYIGKE